MSRNKLLCMLCGFETEGPELASHVNDEHGEFGGFEKYAAHFGGIVPVVSPEIAESLSGNLAFGCSSRPVGLDRITAGERKVLSQVFARSRRFRTDIRVTSDF